MESTARYTDASQSGAQGSSESEDALGQAKEKAQEVGQQAQSTIRDQIDQRTTQAGEQVSGTAEDLRAVGEQLRSQGKDTPARLADQAAERTERVGGYLKQADGDRLLRDVEDFGRRQPWVLALGGLALGVAAARFLKASSSERYQSRPDDAGAETARPPQRIQVPPEPVAPTPTHVPVGNADPAIG